MARFVFVALLAIIASDARAVCRLSWTCPTTRTDGAPFSCANDLSKFRLEITSTAGAITIIDVAATLRAQTRDDPAGTRYRIRAQAIVGGSSAWSAQRTCPAPPPPAAAAPPGAPTIGGAGLQAAP